MKEKHLSLMTRLKEVVSQQKNLNAREKSDLIEEIDALLIGDQQFKTCCPLQVIDKALKILPSIICLIDLFKH